MANYNTNNSMNKSMMSTQGKSIKVKMPAKTQKSNNPKMDKLVNFKAYLDYAIHNLDITFKEFPTTFKPSYQTYFPAQCYCCSSTAKHSQLTCDKYDCAIKLIQEMSAKLTDDKHNVLVNKSSTSCINKIYTHGLTDCISHMIRSLKIKYNKNCICCNHEIPFGLVVCRSVKCISRFILEYGEKYETFRVKYNKDYNARRIASEIEYYGYDDRYDDDYDDRYDDRNDYDRYSEPDCQCCGEGDGGGYYRGCSGCGTLRCGCIDVCRGRCGRDESSW